MRLACCALLALLPLAQALAAETAVAVAANFSLPMQQIAADFAHDTGHKASLSFGASGKFLTQIAHGAPFDVLLSADDEGPAALEKSGAGVSGSRYTYAIGRLVLWSANPDRVDAQGDVLRRPDFRHLAVANPKTAPYGAAASEVMASLGLSASLRPRLVQGENIAQTHQFVASGNAELGFVALAQVWKDGKLTGGSAWLVPADRHQPIRQDALLLARGRDNPAARALLDYLRSDKARQTIRRYGYDLPGGLGNPASPP